MNFSRRFDKHIRKCNDSLSKIASNIEDDTIDILINEIDDSISKQLEVRMMLDNKLLTVLGVIIGFLTFVLTNISIIDLSSYESIKYLKCIAIISNVLIILGIITIIAAIIIMLIAVIPVPYKMLDISDFLSKEVDLDKVNAIWIKEILMKKKQEIHDFYLSYNERKAKAFTIVIIMSIIGFLVVLITSFLSNSIL